MCSMFVMVDGIIGKVDKSQIIRREFCTSRLNPRPPNKEPTASGTYFFHLESAATVEVMTMQVRRDFSDPRVAEMLSTPQC